MDSSDVRSGTRSEKGRVKLVDPNKMIATTPGERNSAPPYEEMTPYVEMYCIRRNGAVVTLQENGRYRMDKGTTAYVVNLMNPDRVNNANTTLYTEDIVGVNNRIHNEGFGIDSIEVTLNANYIPTVDVVFRDVRGTSLFMEGEKSPLAAIFDMPPPVYKLRLKGAFGRFVEYDLHCTDHNGGSIDSSTGDFVIKCHFIGNYFGPLTDMLLGYIKSVPFLKGEDTLINFDDTTTSEINGDATVVNSFFELIQRGDLLYTAVEKFKNQNNDKDLVNSLDSQTSEIESIKRRIEYLRDINDPQLRNFLKSKGKESWTSRITVSDNTKELRYSFRKDETPDANVKLLNGSFTTKTVPVDSATESTQLSALIKQFIEEILIKRLETDNSIIGKDSQKPTRINYRVETTLKLTEENRLNEEYVYTVDYSGLFQQVNTIQARNDIARREIVRSVNSKFSELALEIGGVRPSISNIFRILCNDFDYLVDRIRQAGNQHNKNEANSSGGFEVEAPDVAWPFVEREQQLKLPGSNTIQTQLVKIYPGDNPAYRSWPEVRLVEDYCRAFAKQKATEQQYSNFKQIFDDKNYIPISPLEPIGEVKIVNPYYNQTKTREELYASILQRYLLTKYYSYAEIFTVSEDLQYEKNTPVISGLKEAALPDQEKRKELIKATAKLEAHNLWYVLQAHPDSPSALAVKDLATKNVATIMALLTDSANGYLSKAGFVGASLDFRDKTVYKRNSNDFTGITDILFPTQKLRSSFYTVQVASGTDAVSQDRKKMLDQQADSMFYDGESRKAVISESQNLVFQDALAQKEKGQSDFLNGVVHALPGFIRSGDSTLYESFVYYVILDDYQKLRALPTTSNAAFKDAVFARLDDLDVFTYPYSNITSGKDDILAKFLNPGVVEMPKIYALYLGYKFSKTPNRPKWISPNDRLRFLNLYQDFNLTDKNIGISLTTDLANLREKLLDKNLITASGDIIGVGNLSGNKTDDVIKMAVNEIKSYTSIQELIDPIYVLNSSSLTFLNSDYLSVTEFSGLRAADGTLIDEPTLTVYLDAFHRELLSLLKTSAAEQQKTQNEIEGKIKDRDFKSLVYYNLKDFYDRWIVGTQKELTKPGELFDRFKFVTRAHLPIGEECIVDYSNFIEDARNEEMSVFTSIGRLLQENKFQFFPLSSYMDYDGIANGVDEWAKSFQIDNRLNDSNLSKPAFVCMYMGGFSSRLKNASDKYGDDGFDFEKNIPIDFTSTSNKGSLYAFRAKAADQGQSIFGFPEWSMDEYHPTDVSLKMESNLLDRPTDSRRIRKAQNLLPIYAQRSYTVGMNIPLGNMCIQPTQYFQLEGMPFLNGAYLVHQVTHSISASTNRLDTKFRGYRMGKYIHPIVTEAVLDYSGLDGETNDLLSNSTSQGGGSSFTNLDGDATDGIILGLCQDKRFNYNYHLVKALVVTESAGEGGFSNGKLLINIVKRLFGQYAGTIPPAYEQDYARVPATMPNSQGKRHEYLDLLRRINDTAALKATAMGMGQIMGSNFAVAGKFLGGFTSPQQMYDSFSTGERRQLLGMFGYIQSCKRTGHTPLHDLMQTKDENVTPAVITEIVKLYNGGEYGYTAVFTRNYNAIKGLPLPEPILMNLEADNSLVIARDAWSTQGSDPTGCFRACLRIVGKTQGQARPGLGIAVAQERNGKIVPLNNAQRGFEKIDSYLNRGKPIIVGVDHKPGSVNNDETSDHFVVIVSSGEDATGKYYRFFDPGTGHQELGTSPANRLYYDTNTGVYAGTSAYNAATRTYKLSWVRPTA